MPEDTPAPFSVRNRGASAQLDNDCPETARLGLLHLLRELIMKGYIEGWPTVVRELERIARLRPEQCDSTFEGADQILLQLLEWDKVFDFCERIHNHLAQDVYGQNRETGEYGLIARRSDVQEYVANELRRLFLEEHLVFEFADGVVRRRGRRNTADRISRADLVLGDPRFSASRTHFNKALRYFRNISQPDYENVFKEAVCAVEATARILFPSNGSTLVRP